MHESSTPFSFNLFRMEKEESQRPPSSREVTTLRIKSDQGDQTYILKMKFSQTIGDVKKHLDELRYFYEMI